MRDMPLTVLVTVIVHLFNTCHSIDFWNFSLLEILLSLWAPSSKVNRGKPLVEAWRHHFSKIICQTLNFVEANHSPVPLPCPLWDPTKKTVSSPAFKRLPLSSSRKYLSFAFVPNLFRWTRRSGGRISSAYDISRLKAKSCFSFLRCRVDHY